MSLAGDGHIRRVHHMRSDGDQEDQRVEEEGHRRQVGRSRCNDTMKLKIFS